ncbi:MAG: hypothetical protein JNM25_08880 [Planctomycetes bacterium]|nr:hypothetical protein [Planctomycetota bacterium]
MMHEVRSIPPAPRRIRLRPLLAHRWPLLTIGGAMCVLGTLVAWLMFLQIGGKFSDTARLDRGPCESVTGTVQQVGEPFQDGGRTWRNVRYEFHWHTGGHDLHLTGDSFVAGEAPGVGGSVEVDVLRREANINRIRGGVLLMDRAYLHPQSWFLGVVTPGALLLLGWLAGAFQLRHVLVHGDVSVGYVTAVEPVPLVLPQMLRVDYRFRDHRAIARRGRHWVRVHGELGARLLAQDPLVGVEPLPVLHDRQQPNQSRVLLPQDFLPESTRSKDALSENGVT